ncbi:MAG: class I SAM-dependent methyltransferase [Candidatus Micrarchaeales archaeon]|nr:class I SAM-dependent methyltransferase [Candidatus Micrarchaeales archaeon]
MKDTKKAVKKYERISPTAWFTAEGRTFSDIPYSREIFAAMEKMGAPSELLTTFDKPIRFCRFEARYKIINKYLHDSGNVQILELASGLSPRGLLMAENNASVNYVEVDLPAMLEQKKAVLALIKPSLPENLHLEEGNALKLEELRTATRHFDKKKSIAVIHEGLLRYLSFEEKIEVGRNIATLLREFGGVWITPDITLSSRVHGGQIVEQTKRITGVDITANTFKDVDEAKRFFEGLGFSVEAHSFLEVKNQLVSPPKIGVSDNELEKTLDGYVFVMRLKKGHSGKIVMR